VNAKDAVGRNWRGIATPFADIGAVAEWMRAVQKVTPLVVAGARALRRMLFEGASEDIHSLADAASSADAIDLIGIFSACYTKKISVSQEARSEFERASQLEALRLKPQVRVEIGRKYRGPPHVGLDSIRRQADLGCVLFGVAGQAAA